MSAPMQSRLSGRRQLRFRSIDDLRAEIDRLLDADQAGQLQPTGNWTLGQAFGHLAAWINYAYEGFPIGPPPWFVRWYLRWRLPHYLREGMPTGVRIPRVPGGTYGIEPISAAEGAERLRNALMRLQSDEPAPHDSPVFGKLSPADRIQLNLRHAELHLSFFVDADSPRSY